MCQALGKPRMQGCVPLSSPSTLPCRVLAQQVFQQQLPQPQPQPLVGEGRGFGPGVHLLLETCPSLH